MDGWTMASYPTSYCCVLATLATCITIPLPREYRTDTAFPTETAGVTLVHSPSASSQTVHNGTSPTINTLNILCMITIHNWLIHIRCKSHQTEFHQRLLQPMFSLVNIIHMLITVRHHRSSLLRNNSETQRGPLGHFNFWLSLSLIETLSWMLTSGLRPKFNLTLDLDFRWAKVKK